MKNPTAVYQQGLLGIGHYNQCPARRPSLMVLSIFSVILLLIFVPVASQTAAQEAETEPTCTGCSTSGASNVDSPSGALNPQSPHKAPANDGKHPSEQHAPRGAAARKCYHWLVCATCNNPTWLHALYSACVQRCLTHGFGQCA